MWKKEDKEDKEDNVGAQPSPTLAMYTEAVNKFSKSAAAFMEHVRLLTEARDAYQEAMSASTMLRRSLDAGDQSLRSLMTQLEQVVNAHFGEAALDKKQPETVKDTTVDSASTGGGRTFLP
jgi:hypothetical protein